MEQVEIAAVLALEPFERFVYVVTVLERYSDQDCALLLGCARRDAVAARTRAFEQIASPMASHSRQLPPASSEKPVSDERRSSLLELLVGYDSFLFLRVSPEITTITIIDQWKNTAANRNARGARVTSFLPSCAKSANLGGLLDVERRAGLVEFEG
jgi:hypothetical protein